MSKPNSSSKKRFVQRIIMSVIVVIIIFGFVVNVFAQEGPNVFLPFVSSENGSSLLSYFEEMHLPPITSWWWEPALNSAAVDAGQQLTPTPTPNDDQAKLLPTVVPPVLPTGEVIDVNPGESRRDKFSVIITRSRTGSTATILMSPTSEAFKQISQAYMVGNSELLMNLLEPYLQPGDEFVTIGPPYPGGPRPISSTPTPQVTAPVSATP